MAKRIACRKLTPRLWINKPFSNSRLTSWPNKVKAPTQKMNRLKYKKMKVNKPAENGSVNSRILIRENPANKLLKPNKKICWLEFLSMYIIT